MTKRVMYGKHELVLPDKIKLIDTFLNRGDYVHSPNIEYGASHRGETIDYDSFIKFVRELYTRQLYRMNDVLVNKDKEEKEYIKDPARSITSKEAYLNPGYYASMYDFARNYLGKEIIDLSDEDLINLGTERSNPLFNTKLDKTQRQKDKMVYSFRNALAICYVQGTNYDGLINKKRMDFVHIFPSRIFPLELKDEVRIYLNLVPKNVIEFSKYLLKYSKNENLYPYFKFSSEYRSDEFIIYCGKDELERYLDILTQIKKDHPSICKLADSVDMNLASYDNWIGIGEEVIDELKGIESFSSVRDDAIYDFLCDVRCKFPGEYKYDYIKTINKLKPNDPRVIKLFDQALIKHNIDPNTYAFNLPKNYRNNLNQGNNISKK